MLEKMALEVFGMASKPITAGLSKADVVPGFLAFNPFVGLNFMDGSIVKGDEDGAFNPAHR